MDTTTHTAEVGTVATRAFAPAVPCPAEVVEDYRALLDGLADFDAVAHVTQVLRGLEEVRREVLEPASPATADVQRELATVCGLLPLDEQREVLTWAHDALAEYLTRRHAARATAARPGVAARRSATVLRLVERTR